MRKLICLLFILLATSGWTTSKVLDVAFGSVPASCTAIGVTIPATVKEVFIQNSLDKAVVVSTSSDCVGTNNAFRLLGGISMVWSFPTRTQTSNITLYYKYDSGAPTSGALLINYVE